MQKIITHLWFDDQAEEAANYYVNLFKNSRINSITKYPEAAEEVSGKPAGSVMTVEFELDGTSFVALNGGKMPGFEFTPATSFLISCEDQAEVDHFWEALSADPNSEQCGWCKDKFGISWQVVPKILSELLSSPDQAQVERVTAAFMPMKKLDVAKLEEAARG